MFNKNLKIDIEILKSKVNNLENENKKLKEINFKNDVIKEIETAWLNDKFNKHEQYITQYFPVIVDKNKFVESLKTHPYISEIKHFGGLDFYIWLKTEKEYEAYLDKINYKKGENKNDIKNDK